MVQPDILAPAREELTGRGAPEKVVEYLVHAAPVDRGGAVMRVVPGMVEPDRDHGDGVVADRTEGFTCLHRLDSQALKNWLDAYSLGELWQKNILGGRPSR